MKFIKIVLVMTMVAVGASVLAEDVFINRTPLGSGTPGKSGYEKAWPVGNGLYIAPQYMPYHPTAATIWPRVVEVSCTKESARVLCEDYQWQPRMGRAEYLYFKPVVQTAPAAPPPSVMQPPPRPLPVYPRSRG